MKAWIARLLLCGLGLLCWHCFANLDGGGSSEAEGFTLAGRIVDSGMRPLSGAKVSLFAARPSIAAEGPAAAIDSARADADGWFAFKRVAKGKYAILATAEDAKLAALRSGINLAGSDTLESMTMSRAATLSGRLPVEFPYSRVQRVVLMGTPYRSAVTAGGDFAITGIVAGSYVLALVLHSNFTFADPAVLGALDTIDLAPGQFLVSDSLRVPVLGGGGPFQVDGFSDCDMRNNLGGVWWSTNDRGLGGNSRVDFFGAVDPADGTGGCAARFTFTFGRAAAYPFVGIGTYFLPESDSNPLAVSLEHASGISFRAKGRGAGLEVLLQSSVSGLVSGQGFDIALVPETWTVYTVDFLTKMKNTYDSTDIRSWQQRRKAITHIQFDAIPVNGADSGEVWIDDLQILPR